MKNLLLASIAAFGLATAPAYAQGYNRPIFGDVRIPALGANPSVLAAIQALQARPAATGTGGTGAAGPIGPVGAVGPQGPAGQGFNYRGGWAANTAYNPYDVVTYGGSTYIATTAFTSGATFSTAGLSVVAAAGTAPAFTATASGLAAGGPPTVTLGGTLANPTLTFGIPAGTTGATGACIKFIPGSNISGNGCYFAELYGTVSTTSSTRLALDGSNTATAANQIVIPTGYQILMSINGGGHDPLGTVSYFPGLDPTIIVEAQVPNSGTPSMFTTSGGTNSASNYSQSFSLDTATVPVSLNFTVKDANADPTSWVVIVEFTADH